MNIRDNASRVVRDFVLSEAMHKPMTMGELADRIEKELWEANQDFLRRLEIAEQALEWLATNLKSGVAKEALEKIRGSVGIAHNK